MKTIVFLFFAICLYIHGAVQASGQTPAPEGPPKIILIYREELKPGKGAMHEKVEADYVQAFARSKTPINYLAMTSASGPSEAWFVEAHDSFAEIENWGKEVDKRPALSAELKQLDQRDGELRSNQRIIVATYREELSYRAGVNIPQMRYFNITTIRVRPGHEQDFTEARKIVNAAHEKANMDEHWAVFQVVSGAPSGTYLIFLPMKSMKELDVAQEIHGKPYQDALGEDNQKKLRELASAGFLSSETSLFAFSPKMSHVPKDFAAADPDFWTPKPKPAPKPAAAKTEATKPPPKQ